VSRRYPDRPIVGVGAVIVMDGKVVLIRRRFEPLKGQWSLPGGAVEVGETLEASVAREIREETGLDVDVGPVIEVFDRITMDDDKRVEYHYVLVDYLCWPIGGQLCAGSDCDDAVLVDPADLERFQLTTKATAVIERALQLEPTAPRVARRNPNRTEPEPNPNRTRT
jgi:8-oxo-dGTP diphosphatase